MAPNSIIHAQRRLWRPACVLLMCLCTLVAAALDTRTLMLINSYDDKEPWVDDLTQTVILHTEATPGLECVIVDLNSAFAPDSAAFRRLTRDLIGSMGDRHPSYVVMIGNLAFNMRTEIKEAWGDVPMLLVTRVKGVAPLGEYYGTQGQLHTLGEFRIKGHKDENYNFTALVVPGFYDQTVKMMRDMIPEMNELVLISDTMFFSRHAYEAIDSYLRREAPEVKLKWVKTSIENADTVRRYFETKSVHTGVLISTMGHNSVDLNVPMYSFTNDSRLISYSKNPVFSLGRLSLRYGAVGGAYPSIEAVTGKATAILDAMFAGKDMRNIPIRTVEEYEYVANYPMLGKYGLDVRDCPKGTVMVDKPENFFGRYLWQTVVTMSALLLIFVVFIAHIRYQRLNIRMLRRSASFVRSIPVPYATTKVHFDNEGRITHLEDLIKNDAFERILEDNRLDGSPSLIFPKDVIIPILERVTAAGRAETFSYHFPDTDTYYTFIFRPAESSSVYRSAGSTLVDVFAIDSTEQHRTRLRLQSLARRLDVTLEAAHRDPFTFDISDGRVMYDRYYREGDEGMRHNLTEDFSTRIELVHPDDRHLFTELIYDRRKEDGDRFNFEYRMLSPITGNFDQWMEISGLIERFDSYGRPARLIGSLRVITKRKQREHDMAEALQRASESESMKSSFLANMSHEIRTPLNAIVGFSNVIADTDDADERKRFAETINHNTRLLLTLIDEVMDLAKIEANMVDLSYTDTDINALMLDIRNRCAEDAERDVDVRFCPGAMECVASVDSVRLRQVLGHMAGNACKFTSKGTITIGYEILDDAEIYFYVKDTGRGVAPDDIDRVFDRFFKGDPFVPGTGLGLPICKKIIEKMGGRIGVVSDGEDRGSTFWFAIPFRGATA